MVLISAQVLDYQDFLANTSNIDLLSKKWQIRSKWSWSFSVKMKMELVKVVYNIIL